MQVRAAEPGDVRAVLDLLVQAGLSLAGVPDETAVLLVAEEAERVVGAAGLELHDGDGLLRSVATAPDCRGRRVATTLCEQIELRAESLGLRRLYLLTETAEGFFAKRGYQRVERAEAPRAIAGSRQFETLCPASCSLMCRQP